MRNIVLGIVLVLSGVSECFAFGLTVDQMYRNIVDAEQGGTSSPNKPLLTFKKADSKPEAIWEEKKAYFEKRSQKPSEFNTESQWSDIVIAVKQGRVSPFDLAEIRRLSERENPEAVELLAWMYATAYDNVRAVYRAMSPAQRASLPAF